LIYSQRQERRGALPLYQREERAWRFRNVINLFTLGEERERRREKKEREGFHANISLSCSLSLSRSPFLFGSV